MLKRISVQQLRLGMFIKELCGPWLDHPFWRKTFLLDNPADLQALLASKIKEVWIDCDQGLDLASSETVVSLAHTEAELDAEMADMASEQTAIARVSSDAEFSRAAKILGKSRQAVNSMFEEARMGRAVNADDAQKLVEEISNSVIRNPGALISLARLKTADDYTFMHSVAVCALMVALARQLGLNEAQCRSAGVAGLLHDLGKAAIPLEILNKPGKLTDSEFAIIKTHPREGHQMLLDGKGVDEVTLDVVLHHHEKVDGSGYPDRLSDEQISLFAKMGAVCDVYDAITSNRPYKLGWDPAESLSRMAEWSKGHFDSRVFQAFVKSIGIYPIGSLVLLNCGWLGVVVEQGEKSLLQPQVKVFFSTRSNRRILPEIIHIGQPGRSLRIVSREDPSKWRIPDLNELWSGLPAPVS
ncbi:MAG TPA: HD-GYP domain-containing protein [Accumulibacter sp.]|nr:HD-GYP domain-containing protein [Accumulibacter sp.]HMW18921.1 HD-GYP domain-containing protein [Accumulibacter sp.]HNE12901.1 HD-GYP domain-containing protein [Accumulibacter sp.]HNH23514.1 HD-GYP domain-containing protein [Accumulibacter sp.]HNI73771.1 HD-GYP domain-containing protein [Accumulibacter sp.]